MENKSKICLTTFIYGLKYQSYIPFLLYSCHKAYPQYDVILFIHGELDENVKKLILSLELKNTVHIRENYFSDCPKMTPTKSQSLRWVLWDDCFYDYDYLYIVDIDMFYIREPISLHEQHITHMNFINLPVSNIKRKANYKVANIGLVRNRLKNAGFKSLIKFFTFNKEQFRLSGLHFVKIAEYYSMLTAEVRTKYKLDIYNDNIYNYIMGPGSDEILLYEIVKSIGVDMSKICLQTNSTDMLHFTNPSRNEFRPHHGLHMGIFRSENAIRQSKKILESEPYQFYIKYFIQEIQEEKKFVKILQEAPENIQKSFELFFEYCKISEKY